MIESIADTHKYAVQEAIRVQRRRGHNIAQRLLFNQSRVIPSPHALCQNDEERHISDSIILSNTKSKNNSRNELSIIQEELDSLTGKAEERFAHLLRLSEHDQTLALGEAILKYSTHTTSLEAVHRDRARILQARANALDTELCTLINTSPMEAYQSMGTTLPPSLDTMLLESRGRWISGISVSAAVISSSLAEFRLRIDYELQRISSSQPLLRELTALSDELDSRLSDKTPRPTSHSTLTRRYPTSIRSRINALKSLILLLSTTLETFLESSIPGVEEIPYNSNHEIANNNSNVLSVGEETLNPVLQRLMNALVISSNSDAWTRIESPRVVAWLVRNRFIERHPLENDLYKLSISL